jgi:hypothetical protein
MSLADQLELTLEQLSNQDSFDGDEHPEGLPPNVIPFRSSRRITRPGWRSSWRILRHTLIRPVCTTGGRASLSDQGLDSQSFSCAIPR